MPEAANAAAANVAPSSESSDASMIPNIRVGASCIMAGMLIFACDQSAASDDICLTVEGAYPNSAGTEIPTSVQIKRIIA